MPREKFFANVLKAKEYITAGDIIQVVGSQRFSTPVTGVAAGYLPGGALGQSVALHVPAGTGRLFARRRFAGNPRPLRGRPGGNPAHCRHAPARQDAPRKTWRWKRNCWPTRRNAPSTSCWWTWRATTSGRVCDFGSVRVKDLMIIERYSHVMHIVSQVEGKLSAGQNALRSDARDVPGRHVERRAENPRHADHCRTGADRARPLRRLRRLFFLQRQSGLAASPSAPRCSRTARLTCRPAAAG